MAWDPRVPADKAKKSFRIFMINLALVYIIVFAIVIYKKILTC